MTHLTPGEFVEAVEGTLGEDRHAHLRTCARCTHERAQLHAALLAVEECAIPEPSPLFWTHLSTRVHDAIAADPVQSTRWSAAWLRWRVLTPVGALAVLILTLATALPRQPIVTMANDVAVASDAPGDEQWSALTDLVASLDAEATHDLALLSLGDTERVALHLSAAEQRELVRLLEEEMKKGGR